MRPTLQGQPHVSRWRAVGSHRPQRALVARTKCPDGESRADAARSNACPRPRRQAGTRGRPDPDVRPDARGTRVLATGGKVGHVGATAVVPTDEATLLPSTARYLGSLRRHLARVRSATCV